MSGKAITYVSGKAIAYLPDKVIECKEFEDKNHAFFEQVTTDIARPTSRPKTCSVFILTLSDRPTRRTLKSSMCRTR